MQFLTTKRPIVECFINGKEVAQFLLADISAVRASIKEETGIDIVGIVSYPQMQFAGITLTNKNI